MTTGRDYVRGTVAEFLADLAAKSPTPGGGSVAAMVGATAAALACMVLEYTVGKPKFAAHEERLRQHLDECKRAGEEFRRLVAEDIAAYERLAAAKGADAAIRAEALAGATLVPVEIIALTGGLVGHLDAVKGCSNPYLLGDLKAAAILAHAAGEAAVATARSNLDAMTDRREADRLTDRVDLLLARSQRHRDAVVHFQP